MMAFTISELSQLTSESGTNQRGWGVGEFKQHLSLKNGLISLLISEF